MHVEYRPMRVAPALVLVVAAFCWHPAAVAKTTECTKTGICYCVNEELKPTIQAKVDRFRQVLADQRKAGKAVGYLSVPLTSAGGGNFNVNMDVAAATKATVERRLGADYVYLLNPTTLDADLPKGTGADYMLMWATLLEGADGLGDFDFVYFAGPQDFARYFGFDGNNDLAKLDAYFDKRITSDPDFAKAVANGLTKTAFRKYYGLRASAAVSRGAHDEWNIFRIINEKRRADSKYGTGSQITVYFDGLGVAPHGESSVSEGYVGKCAM
jgi:hypothetical protein